MNHSRMYLFENKAMLTMNRKIILKWYLKHKGEWFYTAHVIFNTSELVDKRRGIYLNTWCIFKIKILYCSKVQFSCKHGLLFDKFWPLFYSWASQYFDYSWKGKLKRMQKVITDIIYGNTCIEKFLEQ